VRTLPLPSSNPASPSIEWQCLRLADMQPLALHRMLRARQEVFVLEQNCVYLDADDADEQAWHLAGWAADWQLMACARIVDPGVKYPEASIGRVLTTKRTRGTGMGRSLLQRAIASATVLHPGIGLRISAQRHLTRFYGDFGFVVVGDAYWEDGIAHVEMVRGGG
jgi:ElaA protein